MSVLDHITYLILVLAALDGHLKVFSIVNIVFCCLFIFILRMASYKRHITKTHKHAKVNKIKEQCILGYMTQCTGVGSSPFPSEQG